MTQPNKIDAGISLRTETKKIERVRDAATGQTFEEHLQSQFCATCGQPATLYQHRQCRPCLLRAFKRTRPIMDHFRGP